MSTNILIVKGDNHPWLYECDYTTSGKPPVVGQIFCLVRIAPNSFERDYPIGIFSVEKIENIGNEQGKKPIAQRMLNFTHRVEFKFIRHKEEGDEGLPVLRVKSHSSEKNTIINGPFLCG